MADDCRCSAKTFFSWATAVGRCIGRDDNLVVDGDCGVGEAETPDDAWMGSSDLPILPRGRQKNNLEKVLGYQCHFSPRIDSALVGVWSRLAAD
jgi:hypothetical protein